MQKCNYIFNQMIYQLLLLLLLHFQNLLKTLMRTLPLTNSLLLDLVRYFRVLYDRIKLRNNLLHHFFQPHSRFLGNSHTPVLEFRMNIDLLYIIFEKDNLHLPLLNILQATQNLKAKYLNIRLLIEYKIQYIFIDRLI